MNSLTRSRLPTQFSSFASGPGPYMSPVSPMVLQNFLESLEKKITERMNALAVRTESQMQQMPRFIESPQPKHVESREVEAESKPAEPAPEKKVNRKGLLELFD